MTIIKNKGSLLKWKDIILHIAIDYIYVKTVMFYDLYKIAQTRIVFFAMKYAYI